MGVFVFTEADKRIIRGAYDILELGGYAQRCVAAVVMRHCRVAFFC